MWAFFLAPLQRENYYLDEVLDYKIYFLLNFPLDNTRRETGHIMEHTQVA
jgi:hypothetical protein